MSNLNIIGLQESECEKIAERLNILLANYSVFHQNTRGAHWNIRGDHFFTLHEKFEELYAGLGAKIDEIAERILTLGYAPQHNYSEHIKTSTIKESQEVNDGTKCVELILESLKIVIELQREILDLTDEANDEGTNALVSEYISEQEKEAWMYRAYLGK